MQRRRTTDDGRRSSDPMHQLVGTLAVERDMVELKLKEREAELEAEMANAAELQVERDELLGVVAYLKAEKVKLKQQVVEEVKLQVGDAMLHANMDIALLLGQERNSAMQRASSVHEELDAPSVLGVERDTLAAQLEAEMANAAEMQVERDELLGVVAYLKAAKVKAKQQVAEEVELQVGDAMLQARMDIALELDQERNFAMRRASSVHEELLWESQAEEDSAGAEELGTEERALLSTLCGLQARLDEARQARADSISDDQAVDTTDAEAALEAAEAVVRAAELEAAAASAQAEACTREATVMEEEQAALEERLEVSFGRPPTLHPFAILSVPAATAIPPHITRGVSGLTRNGAVASQEAEGELIYLEEQQNETDAQDEALQEEVEAARVAVAATHTQRHAHGAAVDLAVGRAAMAAAQAAEAAARGAASHKALATAASRLEEELLAERLVVVVAGLSAEHSAAESRLVAVRRQLADASRSPSLAKASVLPESPTGLAAQLAAVKVEVETLRSQLAQTPSVEAVQAERVEAEAMRAAAAAASTALESAAVRLAESEAHVEELAARSHTLEADLRTAHADMEQQLEFVQAELAVTAQASAEAEAAKEAAFARVAEAAADSAAMAAELDRLLQDAHAMREAQAAVAEAHFTEPACRDSMVAQYDVSIAALEEALDADDPAAAVALFPMDDLSTATDSGGPGGCGGSSTSPSPVARECHPSLSCTLNKPQRPSLTQILTLALAGAAA
jgi:hypothetical protein